MNIEEARIYCLKKKGATESFPFDEYNLVLKVMNKMFALIPLDKGDNMTMKCNHEYALDLREKHEGIVGAYHFNKKYWNQVYFESDVNDSLIKDLIDHSYEEVVAKLTKKQKEELKKL